MNALANLTPCLPPATGYDVGRVRARHHCAQPVMERFGLPATTRASLALYNTHQEGGRAGACGAPGAGDSCLKAVPEDLYQQLIIHRSRRPRNFRPPEHAARRVEGYNPLRGDCLTVCLHLAGDRVADVGFQGAGCAILTASASLMTEAVKGRRVAEVEKRFEVFRLLVTGRPAAADVASGKLAAFRGVADYPARAKCATLPWHTVRAALEGREQGVSTE